MQLSELTVRGFADLLGSDAPAPGGGSAAALAGALGAALTAMVGSLTVGKKKYAEFDGLARETLEKARDLGQNFKERVVLIGHDGLMDAALGKGPGGDQLPLIQLRQPCHAVAQAIGKDQALHLVILPDAVVAPGGVKHPVADIHQVQQPPELFLCQLDLHKKHLHLAGALRLYAQYSRLRRKKPLKIPGKLPKF